MESQHVADVVGTQRVPYIAERPEGFRDILLPAPDETTQLIRLDSNAALKRQHTDTPSPRAQACGITVDDEGGRRVDDIPHRKIRKPTSPKGGQTSAIVGGELLFTTLKVPRWQWSLVKHHSELALEPQPHSLVAPRVGSALS
jgi:hypothetical protein